MPANTRDQAETGDIVQDASTINYQFDVEGEQLWSLQTGTTKTLGIIESMLFGIKKLLGEVGRRHSAAKWNGSDISCTGTISTTGTAVTGVSTLFTTELAVGDYIGPVGGPYREVSAIGSATSATLNQAFASNLGGVAYVRLQTLAERISKISLPTYFSGKVKGCILSYVNTTTLGISSGSGWDSTGNYAFSIGAFTKTTLAWAAGTGNGGLDTGSIAASTTYHWYIIFNTATSAYDVIFSLSASTPALPSGYISYCYIGQSITDGSSHWIQFTSYERLGSIEYLLAVPISSYSLSNMGTAAVSATLTGIPTGVSVEFLGGLDFGNNVASQGFCLVTAIDQTDTAPSSTVFTLSCGASTVAGCYIRCHTNTSAQIRYRVNVSNAGSNISFTANGWIHYRG